MVSKPIIIHIQDVYLPLDNVAYITDTGSGNRLMFKYPHHGIDKPYINITDNELESILVHYEVRTVLPEEEKK